MFSIYSMHGKHHKKLRWNRKKETLAGLWQTDRQTLQVTMYNDTAVQVYNHHFNVKLLFLQQACTKIIINYVNVRRNRLLDATNASRPPTVQVRQQTSYHGNKSPTFPSIPNVPCPNPFIRYFTYLLFLSFPGRPGAPVGAWPPDMLRQQAVTSLTTDVMMTSWSSNMQHRRSWPQTQHISIDDCQRFSDMLGLLSVAWQTIQLSVQHKTAPGS